MIDLWARFERLCRTNSIVELDEALLADSVFNDIVVLNAEGEDVHNLNHSFAIILWRNTEDSKIITSWNFGPPVLAHVGDGLQAGMTKMHRHDYIEMAYVANGEFSQTIGGRKYTFPQGSVCIIDRNSEHADFVSNRDNLVVFLCMKEDFFDEMFLSEIEMSNVQRFIRQALLNQKHLKQFLQFTPRESTADILPVIEQICSEKDANLKGSEHVIKGLMIRVFYYLTRDYELNLAESQTRKMNDLLFLEIDEHLRRNYKEASLTDLSKRFHFQEDYFNRLIKKHTGLTFSEYLRGIRISNAEEMLLRTRAPVTQIIESVGYTNRNRFYKVFRDLHRMTPEQFRRSNRPTEPQSTGKVGNGHRFE